MQPPPGVTIDPNELCEFERLRYEHELAPKEPSKVHIIIEHTCVYLCACIICKDTSYLQFVCILYASSDWGLRVGSNASACM